MYDMSANHSSHHHQAPTNERKNNSTTKKDNSTYKYNPFTCTDTQSGAGRAATPQYNVTQSVVSTKKIRQEKFTPIVE
jgi:hypothetical protein